MKKDYHKGVKLQVYIPEELHKELTEMVNEINSYAVKTSKTEIVTESLYQYVRSWYIQNHF